MPVPVPSVPSEYLFVCTKDPSTAAKVSLLNSDVARRSELQSPVSCQKGYGRFRLIVGSSAEPFFDGLAVLDSRLVRDIPAGSQGRGCYMIARDRGGDVIVEGDPFGAYPIFYYFRNDLLCVSNNIFFIESAMRTLGFPLRRKTRVYGYIACLGNGAFDLTGMEGIHLLPAGGRINIGKQNDVRFVSTEMSSLIYSDRPYDELVDAAADEILGNVGALARSTYPHKVCDVSGGMDSRLVLAALIHEGYKDSFSYMTVGKYPNPDANVGALLRSEFGLRRAANIDPPAIPRTEYDRIRRTVGRTGGLFSMLYDMGLDRHSAAVLRIGGGFGETLRGFFADKFPYDEKHSPLASLRSFVERKGSRFLSKEASEEIQDDFARFEAKVVAEGVQPRHASDAFYLTNRARYHFGTSWRATNIYRGLFHPLYSPSAMKAAYALADTDRRANKLGYDLMRRFDSDITRIPFAEKAWHQSVVSDPPPPVTVRSPSYFREDEGQLAIYPPAAGRSSGAVGSWKRRLAREGRPGRWVRLDETLNSFWQSKPESRDFEQLQPTFVPDAVKRFLSRDHAAFTTRNLAWTAYRFIGTFVWVNELEQTGAEDSYAVSASDEVSA